MNEEPNALRVKADRMRDKAAELREELEASKDDAARKSLRVRIKSVRMLGRWFRSRSGYG